jgi:hypothetical protein
MMKTPDAQSCQTVQSQAHSSRSGRLLRANDGCAIAMTALTLRKRERNLSKVWLRHWNWKTAILSAFIRTFMFVAPNLWGHHRTPGRAFFVEYLYAFLISGFYGSLAQTLDEEYGAVWLGAP